MSDCNLMEKAFDHSDEMNVVKFPMKVWQLLNTCQSGAIRWGPYGKTLLIDYELFQREFLDCSLPMFKTKNVASFVRQLNMYGFKKLHNRQRSTISQCQFPYSHEFINENFRMSRPDLLCKVKRRVLPVNLERVQLRQKQRLIRSEGTRKMYEDILLSTPGLLRFWQIFPENLLTANGEDHIIEPTYQIQAVPALKTTMNGDGTVTIVLPKKQQLDRLIHFDVNTLLDEPCESDSAEDDEGEVDMKWTGPSHNVPAKTDCPDAEGGNYVINDSLMDNFQADITEDKGTIRLDHSEDFINTACLSIPEEDSLYTPIANSIAMI